MFKGNPRLPSALLALTLSMLAAHAARAQGTEATTKPDAAAAQADSAKDSGAQDKTTAQESRRPAQTANAPKQKVNWPAPLTAGEKVKGSLRAAFLSPIPYGLSALTAGITQLGEEKLPHKDNADEFADWGSRAARNFATRTTSNVFSTGIYAALFRQDPRYEPSRSKRFAPRALHAISRVFVTRDDRGRVRPNYSRFAGNFTGSALANVWERSTPGRDRIGTDATLRRFGRSFISLAIGNILIREFGPDIFDR